MQKFIKKTVSHRNKTRNFDSLCRNLALNYDVHYQYHTAGRLAIAIATVRMYLEIFKCMKFGLNRKKVLDFGAGIGCSQFAYDLISPQNWDLTLADMVDDQWRKDENKYFNDVRTSMGYDVIAMSNITKNSIFNLDSNEKFDCVIFNRFPPLTTNEISAKDIKEKLRPWTTDDCVFLYVNGIDTYTNKCDFFVHNDYELLMPNTPFDESYSSSGLVGGMVIAKF